MTESAFVRTAIALIFVGLFNATSDVRADSATRVALSEVRAFPESLTASSDGVLYVSSLAAGGIKRIPSGATRDEPWIPPGAFATRSTFGVLADTASQRRWVCSNDMSAFGIPGPSTVSGSHLKGFDLRTGEGKVSAALPGTRALCNDIAIGQDGSVFVTNSFAPQLLRLKPGGDRLEVWLENEHFVPPSEGGGLDGIAVGGDGHLYVNTFTKGELAHLFDPAKHGPARLPFHITAVPLGR